MASEADGKGIENVGSVKMIANEEDIENGSADGCYCFWFGEPRKVREHQVLWECRGATEKSTFPIKASMGPEKRCLWISVLIYTLVTIAVIGAAVCLLDRQTSALVSTFGGLVWFITVLAHLATAWSDPGFVAYLEGGSQHSLRAGHIRHQNSHQLHICGRCHVQREHGTRHCHRCKRCIREHDHHCPFVGNW